MVDVIEIRTTKEGQRRALVSAEGHSDDGRWSDQSPKGWASIQSKAGALLLAPADPQPVVQQVAAPAVADGVPFELHYWATDHSSAGARIAESVAEVKELMRTGVVDETTDVWVAGWPDWRALGECAAEVSSQAIRSLRVISGSTLSRLLVFPARARRGDGIS